ncbi:peptidase [Methanosarcina sp. 2.H.T.1A.6]|uniref:M1 family metallopeptidase n=1 Tax=unclassified Methanosarcina TaxID=2644672 RepID=UPI00062238B7|nr:MULTISPECIES: M1 family metallopeptidase [unclassified Methanosarcina]KKG15819.1 peptidase [Methanosarcina sp. 2.H.T.1A.3]KKG20209.1 peptidase [Methanosarcina sp. 2.H.T.1A.6]KKG26667.1 peptidase [Methanosarcina sp. 2.H.T.1A.8]KKG27865.1 peptidase [Methanosarcina sp. 2.H.T.1A.15]
MKNRLYKYYPEDFGELTVDVLHMNLVFEVYDDKTNVKSLLRVRTKDAPIETLELNCRDLEIRAVSCIQSEVSYRYRQDDAILEINFRDVIPPHTEIAVVTDTVCRPTKNVLEGLYYDETPAGAPPQQITQCQQWGFQRIVPCIDDMCAKCTYRTTIIADSRYTNLITNGDVVVARHTVKPGRDKIVYDNSVTPMAPYLFFLGVGTYATFSREFEYPDGDTFMLELLVPPGSNAEAAEKALDILHDSAMWVYLFTGAEQFDEDKLLIRKELWELVRKREKIKLDAKSESPLEEELLKVRGELAELNGAITPGYKYTGTVYREIGMQNSDFGGMENVGNTTITTNRIMPSRQITDPAFEYMIRVKVHEYYHNQNGSEVTGKSPFEIWLNEAVTVHVEEQYHAFLFGEDYQRIGRLLDLFAPASGTFALDSGAASMPIIPDGFNDPNDLITAVTYVKSPEYVRMVETLIGKDTFVRGLDRYFKKFSHSNAATQDWIEAMEEESGQPLKEMAETWLKQTKFPVVEVSAEYDLPSRKFTFFLKQQVPAGGKPWEFPFKAALVDENGNDLAEVLERISGETAEITVENVDMPSFLSLNRESSFYGKLVYRASQEELLLQVRKDSDITGRFTAFYTLVDREKLRLLKVPGAAPSEDFIELYYRLFNDRQLLERAGGQFLAIFESVEDEEFAHHYQALFDVKKTLLQAVAWKYRNSLISSYHFFENTSVSRDASLEESARVIKSRQAKNVCLGVLATLDTPDIHALIKQQFETAACATDRLSAFAAYLNSSAPDKIEVLRAFEAESKQNLVAWETFLAVIGNNSSIDAVELVREMERSPAFRIEQTNDQRALYGSFARNRKKSLQTEEGRALFAEILTKLASVNEFSTVNMLNAFANIDQMESKYHIPLVKILADLLGELDSQKFPSVYNRIRKLLLGAPKAVKTYGIEHGEIKALKSEKPETK